MNKNTVIFGVLASLLILGGAFWASAAGDDDSSTSTDSETAVTAVAGASDFTLNADLARLEQGTYEGWIVRDDVKTSTGLFNVTAGGELVGDFSLADITPQDGDTFAVSIEPDNDTDPEPSATIVLAGEVTGEGADLAFPVDISGFSGNYFLATPTDDDDTNETSGVWFLDNSSGEAAAGLNIPEAPAGWIYEGWVVSGGTPLSTGQFTSAAGADSFDGFSGDLAGPPFPGEDFLQNLPEGFTAPLELADGETAVVVSIEPFQNGSDPTGPAPAQLKPLAHTIAVDTADHTVIGLELDTAVPSGSVSF